MTKHEWESVEFKVIDAKFILGSSVDQPQDCFLLRVAAPHTMPIPMDAILRLDVLSYIPHLDGTDLITAIAENATAGLTRPRTLEKALQLWSERSSDSD